jgi:MFS family permease
MTILTITPDRVIRNYLVISGLYTLSASLIWGVNTLFLLEAGLNIQGVFIANAAFTAGMALFEIPTGVIADTVGRRISFLLSVAVLILTTFGYIIVARSGGSLLLFVIVSVFIGLGFTFYSGAVEAWLVDALNATGYAGNLDHVFARGAFVSGGAMLVGTLGGGFLGNVNLAWPYMVRGILLFMVFWIAFFVMHDLGYKTRALNIKTVPGEMRQIADASIKYGWKQRPVRLLMIVGFIQAVFSTWAFYAWQPYLLGLLNQPEAVWISGVVAALIASATMAGNALVDRLAQFCTRRTTLLLWAAGISSAAAIGVGLSGTFWLALILLMIMMGAAGVAQPVSQAYVHQLIPSAERATIISFNSMIASTGSIIGQTGLGRIAQNRSIATGYVVGGLFTVLAIPVLFSLRRLVLTADVIIGDAGSQSACAAHGLPEVSAVDPKAATR